MAKRRRKVVTGFASVGSNGNPYVCMMSRSNPALEGRFEIFDTPEKALKSAWGPAHVRRVRIYVDAEPWQPTAQGKCVEDSK